MVSIQGISDNQLNGLSGYGQVSKLTGSESFTYALDAAKELVAENKMLEADVSQKTMDFMTGESDNVVDLMVAQSKSSIMLQYSLQLRNGLLSAYKEIINLSI
ncbi:MAG: flagellar hook-basal body complex protein FliE [Cellulosilyticum sp.]|nr:flagellar hook-basal body complex protein FliE [Cellulosilyticum sp.]